nr:curli production assembly protein CsgF [Pseudomonas sp. BIGb0427]
MASLVLLASLASAASATELVYTPVNPAFGGNPLNGTWLLNNAQAQNDHEAAIKDRTSAFASTSALERFTSQLESRLLSQLLTNINNGNTGSLQTDALHHQRHRRLGALSIQVTDRVTGEISEIQVNGLNP